MKLGERYLEMEQILGELQYVTDIRRSVPALKGYYVTEPYILVGISRLPDTIFIVSYDVLDYWG
jgi:hypothetical protein